MKNTDNETTESTDEAGNGRMQRLVSLFEQMGFEMLPTGNGKFIVEDPTGGDGLEKLWDQFASREWRNDGDHVCELNQGKHGRCLICDKRMIFIS